MSVRRNGFGLLPVAVSSRSCEEDSIAFMRCVCVQGTLHGQSWALLLGLGLLAPKEQLLSHIKMEVQINCAYDATGQCYLGQQTLAQAPQEAGWALDGSPSMNFDNAANAMWVGGAGFDDPLTIGAKASVALYHERNKDIWDWKDLHMGPGGKTCGTTDRPQGAALAGQPFVNAHYARQLQGWMVQRAASGQYYSAPDKRESLSLSLCLSLVSLCPSLSMRCTVYSLAAGRAGIAPSSRTQPAGRPATIFRARGCRCVCVPCACVCRALPAPAHFLIKADKSSDEQVLWSWAVG